MTDRFFSLTVALEKDIREDDAESLISAIKMMKGVIGASGNVADMASWNGEIRAHARWCEAISKLMQKMSEGNL